MNIDYTADKYSEKRLRSNILWHIRAATVIWLAVAKNHYVFYLLSPRIEKKTQEKMKISFLSIWK